MSTVYPENNRHEVDDLRAEIQELKAKNMQLNIALMRKSAEASEAKEELRRIKLEWEIVADQKGHNLCWAAVARALKVTIGHTGKYPDPEGVTKEEFELGCRAYICDIFESKVAIPEDLKDKGMLTEEQAKIAKKVFEDGSA